MLLVEKQKTDPSAKEIWDYERAYLSELVRRTKVRFRFSIRPPLFPLHGSKARHSRHRRRPFPRQLQQEQNVPSWDPAVETWIVIDRGKPIGRFYLDMHPRPGKYSHAEMAPVTRWHPRQTIA